jgi:tRNA pseudouridine38-40 synthase
MCPSTLAPTAGNPAEPGRDAVVNEAGARGVLLQVAYDGTAFHGWASQKGVRTVEETLLGAVTAIDPRVRSVRGTSRTDAGVHAEGQVVAFDTTRDIPARGWVLGLNQHLPEDVSVRMARPVPPGYAPRFAARGKRYRYRVLVDPVRDPVWRTRAWRVSDVDVDAVAREAEFALGTHDFVAFRSSGDERANTIRTLTRVAVERGPADPRLLGIVVEGNAFLYNMVRILVGTVIDVGRGRLAPGAIARALETRERRLAGTTAPAHGLVLERAEVELPEGSGEPWPS